MENNNLLRISDYCWANVHTQQAYQYWGGWCSWRFIVNNEIYRHAQYNILKSGAENVDATPITHSLDKGYIGGPSSRVDYWLQLEVPSSIAEQYKTISFTLKYNGSTSAIKSNGCGAIIFAEQTDAICAPVNTPTVAPTSASQLSSMQCQEARNGNKLPLSYKTLTEESQYLALAFNTMNDSGECVLKLELKDKNKQFYYINLKNTKDDNWLSVNRNKPADKPLWEILLDSENSERRNNTITYISSNGGPALAEVEKTKLPNESYIISGPTAIWNDKWYGYTFEGWFDTEGKKYSEGDSYAVDNDLTLTAKWTEHTYNLIIQQQLVSWEGEELGQAVTIFNEKLRYTEEKIFDNIVAKIPNAHFAMANNNYKVHSNLNIVENKTSLIEKNSLSLKIKCNKGYATDGEKIVLVTLIYSDKCSLIYPDNTIKIIYAYNLPKTWDYVVKIQEYIDESNKASTSPITKTVTKELKTPSDINYYSINQQNENFISTELVQNIEIEENLETLLPRSILKWRLSSPDFPPPWSNETPMVKLIAKGGSTNLYDIIYSPNGVFIDGVLKSENSKIYYELPKGENEEEQYFSLSRNGGTPHYRSGDFIGVHIQTKLFTTNESGCDYKIYRKDEDKEWKV